MTPCQCQKNANCDAIWVLSITRRDQFLAFLGGIECKKLILSFVLVSRETISLIYQKFLLFDRVPLSLFIPSRIWQMVSRSVRSQQLSASNPNLIQNQAPPSPLHLHSQAGNQQNKIYSPVPTEEEIIKFKMSKPLLSSIQLKLQVGFT